MHEFDQEHFDRRSRGDDRERNDQHSVGVENQLTDVKQQQQEHHPAAEKQGVVGGSNCFKSMESTCGADQRKSPPEDPIPSTKADGNVEAVATDSPDSPS